MTRRKLRCGLVLVVLLLALSMVLSACSKRSETAKPGQPAESPKTPSPAPAQTEEKNEILIGAAVSLTGGLSREGNLIKRGYELWQETVNKAGGLNVGGKKYQVRIIFYDDKSDAQTSAKLTEKLITEDKVKFILGPYSSGITNATSSIGEKYKVITMASGANADNLYERGYQYLFGILPPASFNMVAIPECLAEVKNPPKTVAILYPDSLFPKYAAEGAKKRSEELGMTTVYFEKYPEGTKDFSSMLVTLGGKKPDVFLTAAYLNDLTTIIRQMKEMKINVKAIGAMGTEIPDFVQVLKGDANYVFGAEEWSPREPHSDPLFGSSEKYVATYKQKFNEDPTSDAAYATAACEVLGLAIEKAGSLDTEKVRDALRAIEVETLFGATKFNEKGQNIGRRGAVHQIQDGKVKYVYPKNLKEVEPIYPMPAWDKR